VFLRAIYIPQFSAKTAPWRKPKFTAGGSRNTISGTCTFAVRQHIVSRRMRNGLRVA
jgi:hypothetical protein